VKLIHIESNSEESALKVAKLVAAYKESDMYRRNQAEAPNKLPIQSKKSASDKSKLAFFSQLGKFQLEIASDFQELL
jgi:hypothetical protein